MVSEFASKKYIAKAVGVWFVRVLEGTLGWLFIAPCSFFMPKRKDWVAVIGRQNGKFLDNSKYFYLQASQYAPEARLAFITERLDVLVTLRDVGYEVFRYPSLGAIWFLLRCNTVVVDESAWFAKFRRFLLFGAKIVQLWHGVPLKLVELGRWRREPEEMSPSLRKAIFLGRLSLYRFVGRWIKYDAVVCTSRFFRDTAFKESFRACHFPITGYPRNDFAQSLTGSAEMLAWSNVDRFIKRKLYEWRDQGRRMVLIVPTFHDSGRFPMSLNQNVLGELDKIAEANSIEFVFKFHPSERNADQLKGRHFHVCARDSDVYPLIPYACALVTDYSSISMDVLLVDRPIVFLHSKRDMGNRRDRPLQYDPQDLGAGPVVPDWESLMVALMTQLKTDEYSKSRALLCTEAFGGISQSEATPRLLKFFLDQGWIEGVRADAWYGP